MNEIYAVYWIVVLLVVYFIPWIIAHSRKHHNELAIFLLNLFLGWTFLGWVIALIWSGTAVSVKMTEEEQHGN